MTHRFSVTLSFAPKRSSDRTFFYVYIYIYIYIYIHIYYCMYLYVCMYLNSSPIDELGNWRLKG